ncbi:MAG: OmpH family outer membrane protein [Flavobacteriales bacterium]|nr:OmpH family outer membrane protein [Flavobacteriales bacterium]
MSKRSLLLLLVFWNILLTAAIVWSLVRARVPQRLLEKQLTEIGGANEVQPLPMVRDTGSVPEGRIAYFLMDSVEANYALVKESSDRVRSEGQRMENNLQREMQKAQGRYEQLTSKDHTYSTQAELQQDQAELEQLGQKIQDMRTSAQDQLDKMQTDMLRDITQKIRGFLESYNSTAGYDYIFSIQDAGQIWVGNEGLDITSAVVAGLNQQHQAVKAAKAKQVVRLMREGSGGSG